MDRDYEDQHANLVRMLEEQEALHEKPQIFEPVIILHRERVVINSHSRIDSFVKIEGGEGVWIGQYVHIASFVHLGIGGGRLWIGDYAAVASGARIISGSNEIDQMSMSAVAPRAMQRSTKYETRIEDYAVVLTNAVVLPGVKLHEGAVLAAGSVAVHDIPAWEVWAGTPARFIRKREVR